MKKNLFVTRLLFSFITLTIATIGCKKDQQEAISASQATEASLLTVETETQAQVAFDDVFDNVVGVNAELGVGNVGVFGRTAQAEQTAKIDSLSSCTTLSITPAEPGVFPKTVVINFGSGCYSHGHLRSGKITTVYTGRLREPGKSATTTFDNFKIDSVSVQGTHKITNATTANQPKFSVEVTGAKLTHPNGNVAEWSSIRTITQIDGIATGSPSDDVFSIIGSSNGKRQYMTRQVGWSTEVKEPLIKRNSCRWFVKGSVETTRSAIGANAAWTGTLDFGTGDCDNKAVLTSNGTVYQITLH